ncbi:MAG: F0F1 ATP synthase subunit gamma [Deltaproteobacteria bacterium]|nr:F0F1 ATP synthase subunit gamma [Deltaproteobacteria bacterium]
MSRRKVLEHRLHQYRELNNILTAMKNLSLMESAKLSRYQETQNRVVESIQEASTDFHDHFPQFRLPEGLPPGPLVLIGSERGFCGDFNEKVVTAMDMTLAIHPQPNPDIIAVGRRLAQRLEGDPRLVEALDGPSVLEDLDHTLLELVNALVNLCRKRGVNPLSITVFYHQVEPHHMVEAGVKVYRPAEHFIRHAPKHPYPPLLEMDPALFHTQLVDDYLFAVLHGLFYTTLMAENLRRQQQMQSALQQMDKKIAEWQMRLNSVRQEEITEEIEEIMLSAEHLLRKQREQM